MWYHKQRDQYSWDWESYELYPVVKNQQWGAGTSWAVDTADVSVVCSLHS